jgi:hypothetical protein
MEIERIELPASSLLTTCSTTELYPQYSLQESNPASLPCKGSVLTARLRELVPELRIELRVRAYETRVLPLHHTGYRKRLESNQRPVDLQSTALPLSYASALLTWTRTRANGFTVRCATLTPSAGWPPPGVEPGLMPYEGIVLPLNYSGFLKTMNTFYVHSYLSTLSLSNFEFINNKFIIFINENDCIL